MNNFTRPATALKLLLTALPGLLPQHVCQAQAPNYHLIKKVSLPGVDGWDYLTLDSAARRLYIARSTHVTVLNLDTGEVAGDIPDTPGVHGVAVDDKAGRGFTSNGRNNTVTIFDLKTLKKISDVEVGQGPDAIIFDPATERVFTFNGRGQSSTAIDAITGKVVGTVPVGGRPEFAVSDGVGHIYNNLEDKSAVVSIDTKNLKVDNTWPLAPGEEPSGMAMDIKNRRLFSVCSNQKLTVIDAASGKVVASPTIGNGPDACAYDAAQGLVFSSNGQDGTVTVLKQVTPDQYDVVSTLTTQKSARTMALDSTTHHIFTVAADTVPLAPGATQQGGRGRRQYVPDSFVVLEYGP